MRKVFFFCILFGSFFTNIITGYTLFDDGVDSTQQEVKEKNSSTFSHFTYK